MLVNIFKQQVVTIQTNTWIDINILKPPALSNKYHITRSRIDHPKPILKRNSRKCQKGKKGKAKEQRLTFYLKAKEDRLFSIIICIT